MIFYFSGSGNSYGVAKQIADKIDDKQLFLLAGFTDFKICENVERIGIVFPCYLGTAPDIVLNFKDKLFSLIDKKNVYIFCVITYANSAAATYLHFKENINAWFEVKMPESDIYNASAPTIEKEKKMLSNSESKVDDFANDIWNKNNIVMYKPIPGIYSIAKVANKILKGMYKDFDKKLYADDKCVKCKQCTKFCPVHNITFDEKPIWGSNCINCFGCVNRCPKDSIQVGKKTLKKRRYVHSDYKNIYY